MAASWRLRSSTGSAGGGIGVFVGVGGDWTVGLGDGFEVAVFVGEMRVGVAVGRPVNRLQASSKIGANGRILRSFMCFPA
jgi:hypothetical protein